MLFAALDAGTGFILFLVAVASFTHVVRKLYARVDGPNSEITGGVKELILRYLNSKGGK